MSGAQRVVGGVGARAVVIHAGTLGKMLPAFVHVRMSAELRTPSVPPVAKR